MLRNFKPSLVCAAVTLLAFSSVQAQTAQKHTPAVEQSMTPYGQMYTSNCLQVSADVRDEGLVQKNWQGYATYSFSPEEQAAYLSIIQRVWPYNFYWLDPSEVNDDMAEVANIVLWEIFNCANHLGAWDAIIIDTLSALKGPLGNWQDAEFLEQNQYEILAALDAIGWNWKRKGCIAVAAANWRSVMEAAYAD